MELVCFWTALMFSAPQGSPDFLASRVGPVTLFQSAVSPAQEVRAPVLGSKEERTAKAAANYEANRSVEAALGFEGLWRDFPNEANFLFNAAASRHAAGHHAHAVAYSREYLARTDIGAEDRKEAEAQLRDALTHVFPARAVVVIAPGGSGQVTLSAQHIPRESGDVRPDLQFPAHVVENRATFDLELDPGVWAIRAQGPGYRTVEQRIQVSKGGKQDVNLQLDLAPRPITGEPAAAAQVPPRLAKRLALGFGISGGVTALAGTTVLAVGAARVNKLADFNAFDNADGRVLGFVNRLRLRDAGAIVFGGGLGLVAGGLVWMAKDARTRRIVWITEASVGGAALVGGVIGLFLSAPVIQTGWAMDAESWSQHYDRHDESAEHATSSVLIGFGAGMLGSAVTGLIILHKLGRNVQVQPVMSPTHAGFGVSGRF